MDLNMISISKSFVLLIWLCWTSVYGNSTTPKKNDTSISDDEIVVEHGDNYMYLVIGGYRPKVHTLSKYIVSVRRGRIKKFFGDNHVCGGSILSRNIVLTAAHCIVDAEDKVLKDEFTVVGGSPFMFETISTTTAIKVKKKIKHPVFSMKSLSCDFAILVTEKHFNEDGLTVQRIPLADVKPSGGLNCVSFGWGRIFTEGPRPDELLYVDLTVQRRLKCAEQTPMLNPSMFCATNNDDREKGVWKGDSGGPLICDGKLFGVVSFGQTLGGSNVFANVYEYRKWIIENSAKKLCLQRRVYFLLLVFILLKFLSSK